MIAIVTTATRATYVTMSGPPVGLMTAGEGVTGVGVTVGGGGAVVGGAVGIAEAEGNADATAMWVSAVES